MTYIRRNYCILNPAPSVTSICVSDQEAPAVAVAFDAISSNQMLCILHWRDKKYPTESNVRNSRDSPKMKGDFLSDLDTHG